MSDDSDDSDLVFTDGWNQLLMEIVLLKDHPSFYMLNSLPIGSAARHPFIDLLGPRVLYVKMVALLDEALVSYLDSQGLTLTRAFKNDLNGRISFLNTQGRLGNVAELHRIRMKRNELAHQAGATIDWNQLETDAAIVHAELRHIGFVGEQPFFESFAEREVDLKPGQPGIAMVQHYVVGVKSDAVVFAKYQWSRGIYQRGWDEERVKEALAHGQTPPAGVKDYGEDE